MRKLRKGNKRGFTLIESIVAILIIGITMPSGLLIYQKIIAENGRNEMRIQAANLGQGIVEHLSLLTLNNTVTIEKTAFNSACYGYNGGVNPWPLGTDCVNGASTADNPFYSGAAAFPYLSYQVTVECLVPNLGQPDLSQWAPVGGGCNAGHRYKRVTVDVMNNLTGNVSVETIRFETIVVRD